MNTVTKIVAAMLVLLAVLLGGYAFILATKPPPEPAKPASEPVPLSEKKTPVVVADKLLPGGVPIDAAALKVVELPIDPAGSYRDVSALAGKIPKFDIGPGTPVTESSLVKGLTLLLNEGERAVAVPVDEVVGAGNRVSPGDFVDVFFTLKQGQGQDITKTQARLLLSRLRVLTYGSASAGGDVQQDNGIVVARSNNPPAPAKTAVLAVPTADVNRLLLATQNGKLQLVLRHPTDETAPDVSLFPEPPPVLAAKPGLTKEQREALEKAENQAYAGLELAGLSGETAKRPVPAARPRQPAAAPRPPANTVEVVRGTKREVVGF